MQWLTLPVGWHSPREATYDYTAMTPEQIKLIETRFHDWYTADWDYGLTTIYFFCAAIGLIAVARWGSWAVHRRSTAPASAGAFDRLVALASYTTTRGWRVKVLDYYSPPLAAIIAVLLIFVWVIVMTLAARPYQWPNPAMGYSPPIATRAGWISLGIMPFMIAFATKNNYVAVMTRTSHERLQVFHRWSALFMYITSLVHTFPFIVEDIQMGMMQSEWATDSFVSTGVAALIPQTWLLAMSWGYFRNRYYEFFKNAAGIFMAALFVHVDWTLTAWDYFWATFAIYGTSWGYRVVRATLTPGRATVTVLEDRTLRVRIAVPKRFSWSTAAPQPFQYSAGQHVFVRFLFGPLHWATSHPFTIASTPALPTDPEGPEDNGKTHIELALRARGGITKALERAAEAHSKGEMSLRVFIDGPYGHVGLASDLRRFDRVLFLAGGSGASFTIPLLIDLVRHQATRPAGAKTQFVVAVREGGAFAWLEQELEPLSVEEGSDVVRQTHVTRQQVEEIDPEKGDHACDSGDLGSLQNGRPDLRALIQAICVDAGRVAVVGCGPDEFAHDVRNVVAAEQFAIAQGRSAVSEVFLHVENYSW
ncbi:ferric reductase NAD binding domain-containing protein [Mycena alexandri]|uniref:ferric-chelate reductase (NADPH) n=1 Tax=Mycena alexandri TaxID=1745969 RepID=A0AAD6S7Y8_9AGAR|nr:ferric reductase NAD binding domain-containing protein [Mycena alexandri]